MFVLLPERQFGRKVFSEPVSGTGKYVYLPMETRDLEVSDLWYERRTGPSKDEILRHRIYGTELSTPTGEFSALCHAKFVSDVITWPGSQPDDAIVLRHLIAEVSGRLEYSDKLVLGSYGVYRGHCFTSVLDNDGTYWIRYIYLYFQPKYRSCSIRVVDYRYSRHDVGAYHYVWVRDYGQDAVPMDEDMWSTDYWDAMALIREAVYATYNRIPTLTESRQRKVSIYEHPVSDDYVKAQVSHALSSALRYRDTELVDWSVDALPRNYTPWALGNIDVITGRARAFIAATDDIPLLSENSLQNLAAAFSVLKAFAFGAEAAESYFQRLIRKSHQQKWFAIKAQGGTRAQQRLRQCYRNWMSAKEPIYYSGSELDTAGDAWLKGRYAYSTSVMDLGQAWEYFYDLALQAMGTRSGDYKCHGVGKTDSDSTIACTFTAREIAQQGVVGFFEKCYREGLEPNAYVMWDFVPFSFVVDWFLPIGDALGAYTRASHFAPEYWKFLNIYDGKSFCYSLRYREDTFLGPVDVYTRWYESGPPEVEAAWFLRQGHQVKDGTLVKRVFDGIALFHP